METLAAREALAPTESLLAPLTRHWVLIVIPTPMVLRHAKLVQME